ncbi:polysaccharide deacetylase family protein [Paenibacillus sp. strain BS8-2]
MKKNNLWLLALLLSIQLTGCTTDIETTGNNIESVPPTINGLQTSAPTPASTSTETVSPAVTPAPSPKETAASSLYRMNSATYRFEAIDKTTPGKAVLLTFDDGPKNEVVLKSMLDTLDKHKAKAIFFVNGYRVKQNPELLKLIHEREQTIGNHSYDHIDLKKETKESVEQQLTSVQHDVEALTGIVPRFFRPPYGSGSDDVRESAKNHGMLYMTWSNGSLDWDKSAKDKPEVVIANVMEQLHPGANILMHELSWTAEGLDELLTKLEAKGYIFIDPSTIELTN